MIKDIIVSLGADQNGKAAGDYAISVSRAFDAHLAGVAFAHEPTVPGPIWDGVPASIVATYREESRKTADATRRLFDEAARLAGVVVESHLIATSLEGSGFTFGRMARCYDLSIVGQSRPDSSMLEEQIIEAALFSSGRPVLIVPYIQQTGLKLDRVMVCWDGSRNAARAIADATPILQRAGAIEVVTIEQRERRNALVGADIAQHLARHGFKVELKPIVAKDTDVASTILSYAADSSADLIVMGGYGHSRLREFVLGGATRGMLEAMTVPTLMAH
jgi:nucleotide-binding universal stress UspA family protein